MTALAVRQTDSDAELIERWRSGDESGATDLVHRHGGALARFLVAAGAATDDIDDLVQEAFFRAFRRIDSFAGRSSYRTWLLTIGSNVLKDQWRRRKRRAVVPIDNRDIEDASHDPAGEAVASDMEGRIGPAIAKLPRLQRDVFLLRAQQDATYEDIARALGTTPGAARVHYHHAVKRLKKALD